MLKELMMENMLVDFKEEIKSLHKKYKGLVKDQDELIKEGVLDFDNTDLEYVFDEAKKRYMAAKRGLAIANKLQDPEQKKENQARVMSNLNNLRNFLTRLTKIIQDEVIALERQKSGNQMFDQKPSADIRYDRQAMNQRQ